MIMYVNSASYIVLIVFVGHIGSWWMSFRCLISSVFSFTMISSWYFALAATNANALLAVLCGRRIKKKRKAWKEKANSFDAKKQSDSSGNMKKCLINETDHSSAASTESAETARRRNKTGNSTDARTQPNAAPVSEAAAPAASSNTSQAGTVAASVVSAGTRNTKMSFGTRHTRHTELSRRSGRTNFTASTAQTFSSFATHRRRKAFVAAKLAVMASKVPSLLLPPSGHANKTSSDDVTLETCG